MRASRIAFVSIAALMQIEWSTAVFAWPAATPASGASLAQADEDGPALRWLLNGSTLVSRLGSGTLVGDQSMTPSRLVGLPPRKLVCIHVPTEEI